MKVIATLIAAAFLTACATVSDPPARLPASEVIVSSVEGQESLAPSSPLEQFCENKARLAIVLFMAREDGKTERESLERVRTITKDYRDNGVPMNDSDELDFYRMTRDVFRKTRRGDYVVPVGIYIERFATVEYQNCMTKEDECPLFYSIMTHFAVTTDCSDMY